MVVETFLYETALLRISSGFGSLLVSVDCVCARLARGRQVARLSAWVCVGGFGGERRLRLYRRWEDADDCRCSRSVCARTCGDSSDALCVRESRVNRSGWKVCVCWKA